jgi:nucleotidyltransferase/DNA polymerase involved in DNA repair
MSRKQKMTKIERKLHLLGQLLKRREREIAQCNKAYQEAVSRIQRKNRMTQFQIDSIKAGTWPL